MVFARTDMNINHRMISVHRHHVTVYLVMGYGNKNVEADSFCFLDVCSQSAFVIFYK